ncbi:hypothetical protein JCM8202_001602 [Rhodotorula sphaerocarpa]
MPERSKQSLFVELKAICVPLLETTKAPTVARTVQETTRLLTLFEQALKEAGSAEFTPALANYVFFPLSALLRPPLDGRDRGDAVFEATMRVLASLVPKWRHAGMDPRVRRELWIMTILTLGGPLDPNKPVDTKGKGKAVDATDEAKLAMVSVLLALMRPAEAAQEESPRQEADDDPLGERLDWSKVDASDPSTYANGLPRAKPDPPPPTPILFHTLTTLLGLAAEPTSLLPLQLSSLEALRVLVSQYLADSDSSAGPSPLLATALPGTASALSRIATSRPKAAAASTTGKNSRPQASSVVTAALETLSLLVVSTINDLVTAPLRTASNDAGESDRSAAGATSLEELALSLPSIDDEAAEPDHGPSTTTGPDQAAPTDPTSSAPGVPKGPTIPTAAWLRYTLSSLGLLFTALSPVASHDSPSVRLALADFLATILARCHATLGDRAEKFVEGLLLLAGDDWEDLVGSPARKAIVRALRLDPDTKSAERRVATAELVVRIVHRRYAALPGALRRRDEVVVQRSVKIIRVALGLLGDAAGTGPQADILRDVDRWSWSILSAVELERIPAVGGHGAGGIALAWITRSSEQSSSLEAPYPPIRLRGISEEATLTALTSLWGQLGRSAAQLGVSETVTQQLLGLALGPHRRDALGPSALWALDATLSGMYPSRPDKDGRKLLRSLARAVIALLDEIRSPDAEPQPEESASSDVSSQPEAGERELAGVEHRSGVAEIPSLDAYKPVATREAQQQDRASHRLLLISWSLRVLATCATTLESAFQPLLMQSLYHVLEHSSPTEHPFVVAHAQHALALISHATSYASPQNLVLSNVDYVVNSVSQRLAVARLDPRAPLVLVEMIRLVGKPIVPMVQDLVDDVFEALDDYHGYEEITVGLWAVLDALLKVMEEDLPTIVESDKTTSVSEATASERDWTTLQEWLAARHSPAEEPVKADDPPEGEAEINPEQPFAESRETPASEEAPTEFPSDQVAPPTRAQVVTAQILSKALYFLSHESAFLRARVLSLIASAVPLLSRPALDAKDPAATRTSDLMPVIHRAWPFILNRLADPEPHVVVEAASLVESLARHVGDYMSRRVVDDVWPRFKVLLERLATEERRSAMSLQDRHSTFHRTYRSILQTLLHSARDVPLKELALWDEAMLLRRFLSTRYHPELQALVLSLYRSLAKLNPDAVWLVLSGTIGSDDTLPRFFKFKTEAVNDNIAVLLSELSVA